MQKYNFVRLAEWYWSCKHSDW